MSSITIEVSDLRTMLTTVAAEAAAAALAKVGVIGEAVATTSAPAPKVAQRPKSNSKAKVSAKPTTTAPNVRRLPGFFESKTPADAASLRKGMVFCLKTGGAMYTVKSVLRTANTVTVATDHPRVEQMSLASEKPVTFCYAR